MINKSSIVSIKKFTKLMSDSRNNPENPRDPFINPDVDPISNPRPNTNPEVEPSGDTDAPKEDPEKK